MNILNLIKERINTIYVKYFNQNEIENFPIYYIGGSQTLPPPLSQEEEDELLKQLSIDNLE